MATQKDMIEALRRRRSTSPVPTGSVGEVTKVSRTGPTVEYINPTFEGVKAEAKDIPAVITALNVLRDMYSTADKHVPAPEKDFDAFWTGVGREIGTNPIGRAVGRGHTGAQIFKDITRPSTPIFRKAVGDAGAFTKEDRAALERLYPDMGESEQVRKEKLINAERLISKRIQTYNQMYNALKQRRNRRNG